ncbi:MAG: hypothetical protein ABIW03_03420, partial [Sphingomicrobium sp.]
GGVNGGRIVVEGTAEVVAAEAKSFTGQYLKPLLERSTTTPFVPSEVEGPSSPAKAGAQARKRTRKTPSEPDLPDLIPAK